MYGSGSKRGHASDYLADDRPSHAPSRPVDREKAEAELTLNIKKATSPEETAPKQKHVRKCIVYTWDYHSSVSVWNGLKVQPIMSDEVQTFKALISVHKILQEGHPRTLKEAQAHTGWLDTLARSVAGDGSKGYGTLIRAYVSFILAKLKFHRLHTEFNGTFEYEEYVSLKTIDDPNEGYEAITELMVLQDQMDQFQKLIFAHFRPSTTNECRIAALVPLVKESYGIYRFITSMLRAMHRRTDSADALQPLRSRYQSQHYKLLKFYYECSNLKYLTGLISVPRLPQNPPNLMDAGGAPDLPQRPRNEATPPRVKSPTPPPAAPTPEPVVNHYAEEQRRAQEEYEQTQRALQASREEEMRRQAAQQAQLQREYEEAQRLQAERERQAREALMQQQMSQQQLGRAAELERELLGLRGQYERDQMMLEQYDRRVKALEQEMAQLNMNAQQQLNSKDEMIRNLQEQVEMWKSKYEALAKLYSQLRNEHLDMLQKYKGMQLKANSAQEAIDRLERMERDIKAKNLELADMIRERDRARFNLDRVQATHKDELERMKRDLMFAHERADDATRNKSSEMRDVISKYNRQIEELEQGLKQKQDSIEQLLTKLELKSEEVDRMAMDKEQEMQILQAGMDQTLMQMNDMRLNQDGTDRALNEQIDGLIMNHVKKLNEILDSILQSGVQKIDDAVYELESPVAGGNQNSTPEFTLSVIEQAEKTAYDFSAIFDTYLFGKGTHQDVIKAATSFSQAASDVILNAKGIQRLTEDDVSNANLTRDAKIAGDKAVNFLISLMSSKLDATKRDDELRPESRKELPQTVMRGNSAFIESLKTLTRRIENQSPKTNRMVAANGDLGDLVEREMMAATQAIEAATARLAALIQQPSDRRISAVDREIHESILGAAMAITNAIGQLIKAATASQQEIVAQGKGSSSSAAYYKKNHRWTEGLISAAKAVAMATNLLIETADGVISGRNSWEQLIVASNEVAAATAQLVAASRVKASFMSKTQERLENAAKAVTEACKALVKQVKTIAAKQLLDGEEAIDYTSMQAHEFKVKEMEQQVAILTLEKDLGNARRRLGEMRRHAYHSGDTV